MLCHPSSALLFCFFSFKPPPPAAVLYICMTATIHEKGELCNNRNGAAPVKESPRKKEFSFCFSPLNKTIPSSAVFVLDK